MLLELDPTYELNAIRRPFGDHTGSRASMTSVNRTGLLPSASITQIVPGPISTLVRQNAIFVIEHSTPGANS